MDRDRTNNQSDRDDAAAVDQIEDRVQAEINHLEGRAKERAGQGLQNEELEREGRRQQEEARQELEEDSRKRV